MVDETKFVAEAPSPKATSLKGSSPKTDSKPTSPPGGTIEPETTTELQPDNEVRDHSGIAVHHVLVICTASN
jgi:hypothetical protein